MKFILWGLGIGPNPQSPNNKFIKQSFKIKMPSIILYNFFIYLNEVSYNKIIKNKKTFWVVQIHMKLEIKL